MGIAIVTVAVSDLLESACAVAVIVTGEFGTRAGAVYSPLAPMLPQLRPAQAAPVTVQMTVPLALPVTVAVNCLTAPGARITDFGETATVTRAVSVTVAEADLVESACEVAVTVTIEGLGTISGAV
jgi:formate-dependent phosphoribosylglycinamide formyltransferase (GAR transformylase)